MATNLNDYLNAKTTALDAIADFNFVSRAANADPEYLLAEARWPKALVLDMGGSLSEFNGKIWNRAMGVVIAVMEPRDDLGKTASIELIRLMELVTDAFEADRGDDGIILVNDTDTTPAWVPGGGMIFTKTLTFAYELEKDT